MHRERRVWMGLLVSCAGLLLTACMPAHPSGMMGGFQRGVAREFSSNGERIYFTATSQRGTSIRYDMGPSQMMMGGMMACASCHGPNGRGGRVQMMMTAFTAPDIRWETLTAAGHGHGQSEATHDGEGMEHPPYTEETLKRAITQGVNPADEPLAWPMPRWQMSDEDLNDLVDFLKSLDG